MEYKHSDLMDRLKLLGLVNVSTNQLLAYVGFKNRASIHRYPFNKRVIYIGHSGNLFAIYPVNQGNDSEFLKDAYNILKRFVKGDKEIFNNKYIQWANTRIPLEFKDINPKQILVD